MNNYSNKINIFSQILRDNVLIGVADESFFFIFLLKLESSQTFRLNIFS